MSKDMIDSQLLLLEDAYTCRNKHLALAEELNTRCDTTTCMIFFTMGATG